MIETTYLPKNRFMSLDTEILSNGSLYDFLRSRYGFHADRASETLRPQRVCCWSGAATRELR